MRAKLSIDELDDRSDPDRVFTCNHLDVFIGSPSHTCVAAPLALAQTRSRSRSRSLSLSLSLSLSPSLAVSPSHFSPISISLV